MDAMSELELGPFLVASCSLLDRMREALSVSCGVYLDLLVGV
jgi:hypothetical protein